MLCYVYMCWKQSLRARRGAPDVSLAATRWLSAQPRVYMLVAQVTDSHVRTVEAPHSEAPREGAGDAVHLSGHPRATLEKCLRQAFGGGVSPNPQLLVLTGDNAHGDSEGSEPCKATF